MRNITVDHIVAFLQKDGWTPVNSNEKFSFYSPPEELGFPKEYTLPILLPSTKDKLQYYRVLDDTLEAISKIYDQDINTLIFNINDYLDILKKQAIYFKLESTDIAFNKTLELNDIWHFLKNISNSYLNYLKVRYTKDFFGDSVKKKEEKFYSENLALIQKYSRLRLIDLKYQSFSFGVSTDYLMGNEKIKAIENPSQWRSELLPSFNKDIIDFDFSNKDHVEGIIKNYSDQERRDILLPLIRTLRTESYHVFKTDRNFERKMRLNRPVKSTIDTIITPLKAEEEKKDVSMYQIIVPVDRSKSKLVINTSRIDNDLFSKRTDTINWELNEITYGDKTLRFINPLKVVISYNTEDEEYSVQFEDLQIEIIAQDFDEIGNKLFSEIITDYLTYINILETEDEVNLPTKEKRILYFFKNNLKND